MAEIAIGIDLGTSNSCVAVSRGSSVEVLPNSYGEGTTASVVAFHGDGSITVGNAAKANIIHQPGRTIHSSKRLIGRYFFSEEVKKAQAIYSYEIVEGENHDVRIRVDQEIFSLPEVSAMILREMKSIAETRLGQPVTKAVVTVPAYFNDNQRQATKDAGRIAGLEVLRILNEPTAAALAYGFGKGLHQRVAVWDLGGGTFDISILEIGDDVFEVLSTAGDTFLGGDDFDDRIIDLLAEEFMSKERVNLRHDPFALEKLKVAAEAAKKALSLEDEAEVRIPDVVRAPDGRALSLERTITSQEFSSLVNDLIQRTFKVCDEALQAANVVTRDLDGVILVGGPTRLPIIRHAVQEYFQQEAKVDVDPDQVVAMGAAIHAASLVAPEQDAYLLDVTPLSLRIGVAGGLAETVIHRNTPVPIEQTRTFTTARDHQESVEIRVYQGESQEATENELLGQFRFADFQKGRRGEVEIDVSFAINTDGIVNVTARDQATGKHASTSITLSSGLSERQLETIIREARTDRVATTSERSPGVLGAIPLQQVAASPQFVMELDSRPGEPGEPDDELDLLAPDEAGDELLALDDGPPAPIGEDDDETEEGMAPLAPDEAVTDEMKILPGEEPAPDDDAGRQELTTDGDIDETELDALVRQVSDGDPEELIDLDATDDLAAPDAATEIADEGAFFEHPGTDLSVEAPPDAYEPDEPEKS